MTDSAGREGPHTLDEITAERLLAGGVDPADAPDGYQGVAAVIRAAGAGAHPGELEGEDAARAVFLGETIAAPASALGRARSRKTPVAVALAAAAVLVSSGVAAAATGHLPDPLQRAAHRSLSHVGISIPDASPSSTAPDSTPGGDIRDKARDPNTTGLDKGSAVCAQASADRCRAGTEGPGGSAGDSGNRPDGAPSWVPPEGPGSVLSTLPGSPSGGSEPPVTVPGRPGSTTPTSRPGTPPTSVVPSTTPDAPPAEPIVPRSGGRTVTAGRR